jgi:hypothetical protein
MVAATSLVSLISPDDTDMPLDARKGFAVYAAGGGRSYAKTAQLLGVPGSTVRSWARRYEWVRRLREADEEMTGTAIQAAVVLASAQHQANLEAAIAIRDDPKSPASARIRAIEWISAVGGLVPTNKVEFEGLERQESEGREASLADLQKLVDSGDVQSLVAIAQGRAPRPIKA